MKTGAAIVGITGFFFGTREALEFLRRQRCPTPDSEHKLPTEYIHPEPPLFDDPDRRIALITSAADLDTIPLNIADQNTGEYVETTNFDDTVLLAIQMRGSDGDGGVHFNGVERVTNKVIQSYSCISNPTRDDGAAYYPWIVRVEMEQTPSVALHTHHAHTIETFETESL